MTYRRRASATDNSAVIERLERERDDLRAALDNCKADLQSEKHRRQKFGEELREAQVHCERLRGALNDLYTSLKLPPLLRDGLIEEVDRARKSLNETPVQSLREIQAEAVEEYWEHMCHYGLFNGALKGNEYANQIRKGEDER